MACFQGRKKKPLCVDHVTYLVENQSMNFGSFEYRQQPRPVYHDLFLQTMSRAPPDIHLFCCSSTAAPRRQELVKFLRDLSSSQDVPPSPQTLQILFSFSVPTLEALGVIRQWSEMDHEPVVSLGCGLAYWEYLLAASGVPVHAFDNGAAGYPPEMMYMEVGQGGPQLLGTFPKAILLLAWPDQEEESTFSLECLENFRGDTIIHVGELFGETQSPHPWGASTSSKFQLALLAHFRLVQRVPLPNWPGLRDTLTVWRRLEAPVECDGALFGHLKEPVVGKGCS